MVATALVLIVSNEPDAGTFTLIAAAVIVGREITISALREWMANMGAHARCAVSAVGKFKTIVQMSACR